MHNLSPLHCTTRNSSISCEERRQTEYLLGSSKRTIPTAYIIDDLPHLFSKWQHKCAELVVRASSNANRVSSFYMQRYSTVHKKNGQAGTHDQRNKV
jgi:hypothetical protein